MEHIKDNERDKKETQQKLVEIYEALNLLMDRTRPTKIGYIKSTTVTTSTKNDIVYLAAVGNEYSDQR